MANLYFHNPQTNERSLKFILMTLTIGAAGAVTLTRGIDVTSAAKNGTGLIDIVLPKFYSFAHASFVVVATGAEDHTFQIKAVNAQAGTITVMCKVAGIAADLASGSELHVELKYKNTVVAN